MTKGFISPRAGFTLVEVVVAMTLLLLALTAFVVSFVQSKRSAAIADNRLEAVHLLRNQMETICSSNYINIHTGRFFSSGVYTSGSDVVYTGSYSVICNAVARVKDIAVTVKWVNAVGKITSTVSLAGSVSSELHQ